MRYEDWKERHDAINDKPNFKAADVAELLELTPEEVARMDDDLISVFDSDKDHGSMVVVSWVAVICIVLIAVVVWNLVIG